MDKVQYEKISKPFRNHKQMIDILNKLLTTIGYISYPILLICGKENIVQLILIPGLGFSLLTVIRKMINRKRPYEALDIQPLLIKDTKGKSMPFRHVFSMSIIALSWFLVSPVIGIILLMCSLLLAGIRVIGGVHYPSDVCVAFISACIWSTLYFVL